MKTVAKEKIPNAINFGKFPHPDLSKGNDNNKNIPAPSIWLKELNGSLNPGIGYISLTRITLNS
jgi:hypothetical protein